MRRRIVAGIVLSLTAATSYAALLGRAPLTPGGTDYQGYYDTVLNATWVSDANLLMTSGFDSDGMGTYSVAQAFIQSLNTNNYLGRSDWRLPTMDVDANSLVVDCSSASELDCRDNEMGYMYWKNSVSWASPTPIEGLSIFCCYWSGTFDATHYSLWVFQFRTGIQSQLPAFSDSHRVWAVRNGDISAIPIPAAAWLFGGTLGVLGIARRRSGSQPEI